jgi:hypothetical protein
MKAMVVRVHRIRIGLRRRLDAPPEIINHFLIAMLGGTGAASGLAMLFCGGQQVTTRRAWQTEAHPRYGVTRGEELGLEADRAGSGWDTVNKGKAAGQHG